MTHADALRTLAAERYLLDEMSEIEKFAFEEHFFDCAECADDVRAGSAMRAGAKAAQPGSGVVTSSRPTVIPMAAAKRRWTPAVVVPWAAAATLALAVGYQSLTPGNGGLQIGTLTPVTIRPDSRGAVPTVSIDSDAKAVTLALDVDAPERADLTYVLRTSAGAAVAEGRITAPRAGSPLLLLVPVWTLTPNTQYSLAVQGAADGQEIGEYRFGVAAR
jgi:anti-sigma factor RsiW